MAWRNREKVSFQETKEKIRNRRKFPLKMGKVFIKISAATAFVLLLGYGLTGTKTGKDLMKNLVGNKDKDTTKTEQVANADTAEQKVVVAQEDFDKDSLATDSDTLVIDTSKVPDQTTAVVSNSTDQNNDEFNLDDYDGAGDDYYKKEKEKTEAVNNVVKDLNGGKNK